MNIRKETGRHDILEGVAIRAQNGGYGAAGFVRGYKCKNCGREYEKNPPVTGCPMGVKVSQLGRSQFNEYTREPGRI